jgi:hypothetical protein
MSDTIVKALEAFNGYAWDTGYSQFCRDLGLKEDSYSEGLFRAAGEVSRAMKTISPEMVAKIIDLRMVSKTSTVIGNRYTSHLTIEDLFGILIDKLTIEKARASSVTSASNVARAIAIAITELETAWLWWKDSQR